MVVMVGNVEMVEVVETVEIGGWRVVSKDGNGGDGELVGKRWV